MREGQDRKRVAGLAILCLLLASTGRDSADAQATTDIAIGPGVQRTEVKRLGINITGQNFYDSGQMLRNLIFRNPGFEGETWQSILHCTAATATSCTDQNRWTQWPANFLKGGRFEFIAGPAKGSVGTILSSTVAGGDASDHGITFNFDALTTAPSGCGEPRKDPCGDYVIVHVDIPGNAQAGWWLDGKPDFFSTEFHDLPPGTAGKQALRITAGDSASVNSFFDTTERRSFVQLHGSFRLSFKAKAVVGDAKLQVDLKRIASDHRGPYFTKSVGLSNAWQEYSFDFAVNEKGNPIGSVELSLGVRNAAILLDDVTLTAAAGADNPTAFRDEVVSALRELHPGVLRYMDSGTDFGSSVDNMIAPPFGRVRTGASVLRKTFDDVPLGLDEFLVLCKAVGAEPWYSMPVAMSPAEAHNLIDYLAGPVSTPYGAKRAALGHPEPWTSVFPAIHLELGNEAWNQGTFYGSTVGDPEVFGKRAQEIFSAARSTPSYAPAKFDLILGTFTAVPWWTQHEVAGNGGYDTVAIAPYLFRDFNDVSSKEAIFGPMFAQPEMMDSATEGLVKQQIAAAKDAPAPAKVAVYEVNLNAELGSATQAAIDSSIPSVAAGIAVAEHMLLMLRDDGITTQALFSLPGLINRFATTNGPAQTTPLWGVTIDMGGATNLRRPQYYAEQLANKAILPTMVTTSLAGDDPTWDQPLSANDKIELKGAHLLQTFAFADGNQHSLIVFNLSREKALPVTFSGASAPAGTVEISQLTSKNITDTNETSGTVAPTVSTRTDFDPHAEFALPPFSMTVLRWTTGH
jgi:alpha-L-arabinofuranosidase